MPSVTSGSSNNATIGGGSGDSLFGVNFSNFDVDVGVKGAQIDAALANAKKYIPKYPYFVFIDLKLGDKYLSPIPPEHIQSLQVTTSKANIIPEGSITLFDETAVNIEYEIVKRGITGEAAAKAKKNKELVLRWGYVDGPVSELFSYTIKDYSTNFANDGTVTLTINFVGVPLEQKPVTKAYTETHDGIVEGKSIEDIVREVAEEAGWRVTDDSIEPIKDVYEEDYNLDPETNVAANTKVRKKFKRVNKTPAKFIVEDIAPYCISKKNNLSGYTLWFDPVYSEERPSNMANLDILEQSINTLGDKVKNIGQNFLYNLLGALGLPALDSNRLTNTVLSQIIRETAANTILEAVIDIIEQIQASGGFGGFITNLIIKSVTGMLDAVIGSFTANLTGALTSAMSSLGSEALTKGVTSMITSAVNKLTSNIYGSITGAIKGHLCKVVDDMDRLDEITNRTPGQFELTGDPNTNSIISLQDPENINDALGESFKAATEQLVDTIADETGNIIEKSIDSIVSKAKSELADSELERLDRNMPTMYFKPQLDWNLPSNNTGKDFLAGIPDIFRFEYGTGLNSNVISINFSYQGAKMAAGGNKVNVATLDKATNLLAQAGYDKSVNQYNVEYSTDEDTYTRSTVMIQQSSGSLDEMNAKAAYLWTKGRIVIQDQASIEIIGDPRIAIGNKTNVCSVLILTKQGNVYHRSGVYIFHKITHNISGGSYTTSLELKGGNNGTEENWHNSILAGLEQAVRGHSANNANNANNSGNVEGAVAWAIGKANDSNCGYSTTERKGPNYDCTSFVSCAYQEGGKFNIYTGDPPNSDLIQKFKAARFEEIKGTIDPKSLQKGDILVGANHVALYIGDNKIAAAMSADVSKEDQIKITEISDASNYHTILRPPKQTVANVSAPNTNAVDFKATTYAPAEGDAMEGGLDAAWGGAKFFEGKTIDNHYLAVDPSVIPYGSVVFVTFPDEHQNLTGEYLAVDCGGGINGNHIDVYVGNQKDGANPNQFSTTVKLQMTGKKWPDASTAGNWKPGWS